MRRKFLDLSMVPACSSKLWCFEWNGILSIPQVRRKPSPHEENITHMSSLKTSSKKATHWNEINQRKFPTEPSNFVWLFAIYIWVLTCYTYLPMFSRMGEYQESVTNVSMVADLARNPPNSLNESHLAETAGPGTPGRSTTENWEAGTSHRRASVCGSNPVRGLEEVAMKRVSERRSKMTAWSQTQQFAGSSQQTIFGDPTFLVPFSLFWTVPR